MRDTWGELTLEMGEKLEAEGNWGKQDIAMKLNKLETSNKNTKVNPEKHSKHKDHDSVLTICTMTLNMSTNSFKISEKAF